MKVYKPGDSICFTYEDGTRAYAEVVDRYEGFDSAPDAYEVLLNDSGEQVRVEAGQIVDWEAVSQAAADALERFDTARQIRADMLSELLGALSYYADRAGEIQFNDDGKRGYTSLRILVDHFTAKRDSADALAAEEVAAKRAGRIVTSGHCGNEHCTRTH